jgi:hypothetical protein
MTLTATDEKKKALVKLAECIGSHKDWWLFPTEPLVQGFLGTGTIFIVGDQPSTDPWEITHPHRRAFYELLAAEDAGDCHLTDLYKRRGRAGELRKRTRMPKEFDEHLKIFRKEVRLLRPSVILALGWDAYCLLLMHTPELSSIIKRVWHFGTVRHGKRVEFQTRLRSAIIAARKRDLK